MNATPMLPTATYTPINAREVHELVQMHSKMHGKVLPHGAQTKPPLLHVDAEESVAHLDMTQITGIIEYDPGEYTFTTYAGTRLSELAAALAEHGQYIPFDPPLVETGATLGGTIAAGISGSGRYRYGGLRDFILGVQIVDGSGHLIRGGGKVVKNAAGFDLPKLMVGSMGRLGILISASFKVFPAPRQMATLRAAFVSLNEALAAMAKLMGGPYDLEALDLLPQANKTVELHARIGGPSDVLVARLDRLRSLVGNGEAIMDDLCLWRDAREFAWVNAKSLLVKVATTPQTIATLDAALQAANAPRRYAVGGNLAWIAWPDSVEACHALLVQRNTSGLVLRGESPRALIGTPMQSTFLNRVQSALDPTHRFLDFE